MCVGIWVPGDQYLQQTPALRAAYYLLKVVFWLRSGALRDFQIDITFPGIFSLLEHLASRIMGFSQRVAGLIYDANWCDS